MNKEVIAEIGKNSTLLFDSFFNEKTRKQSKNIIIISVTILLLSYGIIEITEGSLFGLKIKTSEVGNLIIILKGVGVYLLFMYLLSLYKNWIQLKYNLIPLTTALVKSKEYRNDVLKERIIKDNEISEKLKKLIEERKNKWKELKLDDDDDDDDDIMLKLDAHSLHCQNDGYDELSKIRWDRLKDFSNDNSIEDDHLLKFFRKTTKFQKVIFRLSTLTEIILPISICLFALFSEYK